ncbi:MAG TPA: LEPR-XLL domain-containing protein, partial [Burkholderiales bacterium]|nr:LEPR-XLL domain-containing protein [Burkholderiales bacterium]
MKKTSALRAGLASLGRKFAPSLISRALKEVFSGRGSSPVRAPRSRQAQAFLLEALEPRLLLSAAPIDYTLAATTNLTLSAVDATHVQLSGGSYTSASTDLSASSGALDIFRGSVAADLAADTIHLDLNSLQQLTTGLSVNFTGGLQSLLYQDLVQLDGAGTFGFDVKVQSDSAIKVSATASLDASGHDITLQASEKNSVLGVDGYNLAADATHASVIVLGDLSGANISLKADSTIDTQTKSADVAGLAKLAFILGFSTADVEVGGSSVSHITATSKLDLAATSTVKIVADMTADGGKPANNTDAAVATVGITTNTHARITGNVVVDTTGALLNVSAKSSSTGIAIGDGTSGGAGATVGATVITGETVAAVNDHARITDASGVSITADRLNDATAVAKSTTKGSTDGDSSQESKKQLSKNDAQTGGGNSVSFAGAVAVSTVVSHSSAYLDTAGSVQSSGSLAVISTSATNSQARADGSATVADHDSNAANNTNVGIAVGI